MIELVGTPEAIWSVNFIDEPGKGIFEIPGFFKPYVKQLDEYFNGKRRDFSLPLHIQGTKFQKKVWEALLDIPYGTTQSYAGIAEKIGHQNAFRAVGNANNKNKIAIIVPCHRVIGSDGGLTGYACGLWRKEWLLAHEKNNL